MTGGAPKTLVVKGYPTGGKSYIDIALRNISFAGITDDPHFILEDVNYVWAEDVSVNGREWIDIPGNEAPSSAVILSAPVVCTLLCFTIAAFIRKIN